MPVGLSRRGRVLLTWSMPSTQQSEPSSTTESTWQFALFFFLVLLILIQAPLRGSLWLDEGVSFWVTNGSLSDALHRSLNYQGMSPLYFVLLWYARQLIGQSELALRLPSILATAVSCGFLYAIARNLFGKQTAVLCITFFICQDVTQKLALSARPYAAAVMCTLWSIHALLTWLRSGGRTSQFEYIFATALAIYFQYLFAPILLIHLLFVVTLPPRDNAKIRKFLFVLLPTTAIVLSPGLYQLVLLAQKSNTIKFMMEREIGDLFLAVAPMNILAYLAIALAFGLVYDRYRWRSADASESRIIPVLLVWIIFPAFWLFLYSRLTAGSVFVDRFYAWAAPASALFLAWLICHIEPQRARRNIFLVFVVMAGLRELQHQWHVEDWKAAVAIVNRSDSQNIPIFLYSGLIESEQISWYSQPEKAAYLRAPLAAYPSAKETLLLPGSFEEQSAQQYVQQLLNPEQGQLDHFMLIALHIKHEVRPGVWQPVDEYMTEYFGKQGYKAKKLEEKNLVRVIEFERSTT